MLTTRLRFLTAGESHGPELIAILEGLPAGLPLNSEIIDREMERRQRGYGSGPRMKMERDHAEILGGVMDGLTIGSPLALRIENLNIVGYEVLVTLPSFSFVVKLTHFSENFTLPVPKASSSASGVRCITGLVVK